MNKMLAIVFVGAVVAMASAIVKRQATGGFILSDGAEELLGQIVAGFTCDGKPYGYYADVPNACRIFHVCVPEVLADGTQQTRTFSFFCGNQTVFDQHYLVCAHDADATPCDQAESFYTSSNENFGRTDVPFLAAI